MKISAACIRCMVDRQEDHIKDMQDEHQKSAYMKEILRIIGNSDEDATAPLLTAEVQKAYQKYFGEAQDYSEIIYYLFLCKCDWFVKRFHMEKNGGIFVHESMLGAEFKK